VTTQFISNIERGVTPLPSTHIKNLAAALETTEQEVISVLEKDYTQKLSNKLGLAGAVDGEPVRTQRQMQSPAQPLVMVDGADKDDFSRIYEAYRAADQETREAFLAACRAIFRI